MSFDPLSFDPISYDLSDILPPLVAGDLEIRLSGGASNTDFNLSLGGAKSNTEVVNNFNNNIFDDVAEAEHTTGDIEYRCIYLYNSSTTTPMNNMKVYIYTNTSSSEDEWDIGLGTSGLNGTEQTVANESTNPLDVIFIHPTSEVDALEIETIGIGEHYPIWFRRTVNAGSATVSDVNISIRYVFDEN